MLSFLYVYSDHSILECYNLFSGVELSMRTFFVIIKRLKEMCINTKYSMNIIEKVFKYGETELSIIKCKDDIWFRGKTLAEVLGYSNPLKAIRTHIDSEDKKEMSELVYK